MRWEDGVDQDMRILEVKNWKKVALERDEWAKLLNLQEPCVLYIGRAYCYPPDVSFYIYFFNKYKY
jgi:hypothetical protein